MEIILGYNNFFENEECEIEEKIKKLEQIKEMTLVEIRDRIKSDKNYEFWFLINNIYQTKHGIFDLYQKNKQIKKLASILVLDEAK